MAEVEYKGIKVGGSKLLLIIPLVGTIIGGLWGGFEAYQRYLSMEKKIANFFCLGEYFLKGIISSLLFWLIYERLRQ